MSMYPTLEEVEEANKHQLAHWYRFLPSPGESQIGQLNFEEQLEKEVKILNRILVRFKELGSWTPSLSKSVGWGIRYGNIRRD